MAGVELKEQNGRISRGNMELVTHTNLKGRSTGGDLNVNSAGFRLSVQDMQPLTHREPR